LAARFDLPDLLADLVLSEAHSAARFDLPDLLADLVLSEAHSAARFDLPDLLADPVLPAAHSAARFDLPVLLAALVLLAHLVQLVAALLLRSIVPAAVSAIVRYRPWLAAEHFHPPVPPDLVPMHP
jgi:hypothetical protein